jgi:uncharacterized protein YndB with AHSA1/START domain
MDAVYQSPAPATSDAEMALTRVFHAPRRRVFDAFTRPQELVKWWGPEGFTLASCELELRVGGSLRFVMRAPDGRRSTFHGIYVELLPPARLVFTAEIEEAPVNLLVTTVNFEEVDGSTWLTIHQTIPRTAEYAAGQRQGWSESLERLALHLAGA